MLRFLGAILFVIIILGLIFPLSGATLVAMMMAGGAVGLVVGLIVRSINRRY